MKIQIFLLIILLGCFKSSNSNVCSSATTFFSFKDTSSFQQSQNCPTKQDGPVTDSAFYFDYPVSETSSCNIWSSSQQDWNKNFTIYFWLKLTKLNIDTQQYIYHQEDIQIYLEDNQMKFSFWGQYLYYIQLTDQLLDWNQIAVSNYYDTINNNFWVEVYFNASQVYYQGFQKHTFQGSNEFVEVGKYAQKQNFIVDDFTIYDQYLNFTPLQCMYSLCPMPCPNSQKFCTKQSQFCGQEVDNDEENSAKITFIRTYSDQITSPLKWKTVTERLQEPALEYGYQYWFKWDYLWRDDYQFDFDYFSQKVGLSFLSEYEDQAFEDDDYGKKSLCLWLDFTNNDRIIQSSTYNIAAGEESYNKQLENVEFEQNGFDNTWMYLHFSYSSKLQKVALSIKFSDRDYYNHQVLENIQHYQIDDQNGLFFRLANTHDAHKTPGFQGFYKNVRFNYGQEGIYKDYAGFASVLHNLKSPYKPLTQGSHDLTLVYDGDTTRNNLVITNESQYYPKFNLDYPIEYNIHGWFKLPIGFSSTNKKKVIYKMATKNTAKSTNRSLNDIGDHTFYAWIENNQLTFETYSVADIHRPQTQGVSLTFNVSQDQLENDFYFYQGYSKEAGMVVTYLKPYDSTTGILRQHPSEQNDKVIHMRSADYKIYLGGDGESHIPQAEFSCVKFEFGSGSFISSPEDNLIYYSSIEDCVTEGDKSSYNIGQEYSLESYNNRGFYMSHGSPSYLTDSLENIGNFELVDGLVGDIDTVSLRSTYEIENEERQNFFWRHTDDFVIREMQNDETETFAADASFIIHKDLFIPGTIALESINHRGYYVRHRGNTMQLSQKVDHKDFYEDASWIIVDGAGSQTPTVNLAPVYRLQHPETLDTFLTIDEDKVQVMTELGYVTYNQPASDGEAETNVIGYAFNAFWDSYTTAVFEFKNLETQTHYYSTDANDNPEGFVLNVIAFYAYPINYERTKPVQEYTYVETDKYVWTTSIKEQNETLNDNTVYTHQEKKFWIYGSDDDVCLHDMAQCGPPIPEPCEHPYQYRPNQSSQCTECFGEVNPYDHSEGVISKYYTATCEPCEGGQHSYNEDEFGNRTCIECPFGTKHDDVCYLHCDTTSYKYLNIDTMQCQQCDGVLQPHPSGIENLDICVPCDRVDMKRECKQGNQQSIYVIAPNVCPTGHEQIREFRVCSECPLEKDWVLNQDDGLYYCIQTCEDESHYVNDQGQCTPCTNGFLYDDGTGANKCAPNVNFDPVTKHYEEPFDYSYEVPEDQLDDIKEFGFWMWIRPQFLSPKKFDFHQSQTQKKRIGGFAKVNKDDDESTDVDFTSENYGMAAYVEEHDDPEQENEQIMFSAFTPETQNTFPVNRDDYEYEWIFVFMAQQVTQQRRCSYLYASKSQNYHFTHDQASEINLETHKLVFYAGRQFYLNSYTNMGFQGQFYNIELRFGYSGIYQENNNGFNNYFQSQNQPLSMVPVTMVVTDKYDITPVDQYVKLSDLSEEDRTSYLDNLHGTQKFSVYGWFKAENLAVTKKQILFNMQDVASNQENTYWQQALKLGDLSLTCELIPSNLGIYSYSTNAMGEQTYTKPDYSNHLQFSKEQYTSWFFIYMAYDRTSRVSWSYYQNILTYEKSFNKVEELDFWHYRPDEQVLRLGQWPYEELDERYYENFNGEVYNIKLQYHNTCDYQDLECVEQLAKDSTPTPAPEGQCVIMYDQTNFQGNFISVCDKNNSYQMEVNSIYIPEGIEFTIWEQKNFLGLTVIYNLSQPNIVEWNFTLLLQDKIHGAKVMKNGPYFELIRKQSAQQIQGGSYVNESYVEDQQQIQVLSQTAQSMSQDFDSQEYKNMDQLKSKSKISHKNPMTVDQTTETNANDNDQVQVIKVKQTYENKVKFDDQVVREQKQEFEKEQKIYEDNTVKENTLVYDISNQKAPQVDDKLNEVNSDDSQNYEKQNAKEVVSTDNTDENDENDTLKDQKDQENKKKTKKETENKNEEVDIDSATQEYQSKKTHLRRN